MTKHEILAVLQEIEPFSMLDIKVIESISARVSVEEFKNGNYVFKQGDPSLDTLFIIAAGLAEIIVTNERGVESVVGLRKQGDFFSETVVLSRQNYPAAARAKDGLVCILLAREDLEDLIHNYSEFSGYFNVILAERMRILYEKILAEQNFVLSGGFELPLFNKRVSEVMSGSVVVCRTDDQVASAAQKMAAKGISSAVVVDSHNIPRGIVTEKDFVYNLITRQRYPVNNCTVEQVMNHDLVEIAPDAFIGQALVALTRSKTKYLLVMERGQLVGILTAVDLIKSRDMGGLILLQDIESRKTMKGLVRLSGETDGVLNALLTEGAKVPVILEVMSELNERLTRAVIRVAEKEMEEQGLGAPPVDYCWINMGSDARHEQTIRTDQDNAMIYDDPEKENLKDVDFYFKTLAEIIVTCLNDCGFALCPGNVMATNPKWRRPVSSWLASVEKWADSFDPDDARLMTILLDFRPVWGNYALADILWNKIFDQFNNPEKINHMLTNDELKYDTPIKLLGRIRTEQKGPHKDQVNLKTSGLVHLVNGLRIFAINNNIKEPSTLGRLEKLVEIGAISKKDGNLFKTGFETLTIFKIRENFKKIKQNQEPDNYISPALLEKSERTLLKDALSAVPQMQKLIFNGFSAVWLNFSS
ncbi:MAG: DUF294 nucleotidyltransferase-like domain-containing protein [Thermodesulfobacteriota bacterium]|nr:DUF294 nucleotidyltransferase-like domain-containing protein [Thermodesulfobacteriota bacterium]